MPCAVLCIPDGHHEKCKADIAALQKKVKGMRFAVTHTPLDAIEKATEMGAGEPTKKCSLVIVHSKFFSITKDPFCATLFKSMQKNNSAGWGCGKHSACDKPGKKFHWYMGEDGAWDIAMAAKQCEKLMDGEFTESGYQGKPLRKKAAAGAENAAAGGMDAPMMMGGSMGGMGGMGMTGMGGMNGMMGGMNGMNGMMGGMNGMMGGVGGTMGGMGGTMGGTMGGMGGTMGGMGGMGGLNGSMADLNTGGMNATFSRVGSLSGGMGAMGGGMADLNSSGNLGGSMASLSAPLAGPVGSFSGGMGGTGGMGGMASGALIDAPKSAPADILAETENMLSQAMPVTEVVKMLANEVQRLSNLVQQRV